jgi:hypothetical protein
MIAELAVRSFVYIAAQNFECVRINGQNINKKAAEINFL